MGGVSDIYYDEDLEIVSIRYEPYQYVNSGPTPYEVSDKGVYVVGHEGVVSIERKDASSRLFIIHWDSGSTYEVLNPTFVHSRLGKV
jgi:hypothetical protein